VEAKRWREIEVHGILAGRCALHGLCETNGGGGRKHIPTMRRQRVFAGRAKQSEYFLGVDDQGYLRPIYWVRTLDPIYVARLSTPPPMSARRTGLGGLHKRAGQGGGYPYRAGVSR